MNRTNKPNKDGLIVIDFNGHVKAEFRIENDNIIVESGRPIKIED